MFRRRAQTIPAVSMPMASKFNEKVAFDLKIWGKKDEVMEGAVLHIIDMFTKFHQAVYLGDKSARSVGDALMQRWVAVFGIPDAFVHDNGGEALGEEVRELRSMLNIRSISTGAESAWSNGLIERHHKTVDDMFESLCKDFPETDRNTLLTWACSVKNSIYSN